VASEGSAEPAVAHDIRARGAEIAGEPLLVAAVSLVVERASADAVATLKDAGIRAILLKGPPQQEWLAAAGPPRASIDVDLLVEPLNAESAGREFSKLGYRHTPMVTPGVGHHALLWTAPECVPVEVHDALWGVDGDAWGVFARETEAVMLAGEPVEVPNAATRCLVVALHAAHHGVGDNVTKYDLERALVVAERTSWEQAAALAREIRAEPAFAAGLGLVPSGERLRAELGLAEPTLTERLALDIATPTAGAAGYYWFSQQHGARARARFVLRKLIPPADFMRYKHASASRGRGHLLLVYLYRPFWLARWAIPGLLEWRRIRAGARRRAH
jgi:Uncharacterised nucleotidyltransferase